MKRYLAVYMVDTMIAIIVWVHIPAMAESQIAARVTELATHIHTEMLRCFSPITGDRENEEERHHIIANEMIDCAGEIDGTKHSAPIEHL